jgi:hypothetical protein
MPRAWTEQEHHIRRTLDSGVQPSQHFGWLIQSLRAAMDEIAWLQAELDAARVKPKGRKRESD